MMMCKESMPISKKKGQQLFWWRESKEKRVSQRNSRIGIKLNKQMSKRRRFVIVALLLTLGLFVIQRMSVERRGIAIVVLGAASYGLSLWSLRRDLKGVAWIVDLILPTLYPMAVALFYFLLPQEFLTRVIMFIVFAISMYALLLTANIFAVATNRTIQLLRAARTVGFLLSVMTATLIYHVILSLNLPVWAVTGLVTMVAFPVFLQGVWGYTLGIKLEKGELLYSLIGAVLTLELTLALTFWQIEPLMGSVLLSMMTYVLLGLYQQDIDKRLFRKTTQEYLWFAGVAYLVVSTVVMSRWMS